MNRLFPGSCQDMREITDGSVDLVVTSPPYWVDPGDAYLGPALLKDGQGATPATYPDLLRWLQACFAEVYRVLGPGRLACVNVATTIVGGRLYPLPFHLVKALEDLGFVFHQDLLWRRWRGWDKRGGVLIQHPYPGYFRPNRVIEYVLVFQKPGGAPLWAGRDEAARAASRIAVDDFLTREVSNNVWNILPVPPGSRRGHPCAYPEELAYRLITLYSYAGDLVLDPFLGSGTTAKVAKLTGRRYAGYEVNPAFLALARRRLDEPGLERQRYRTRFEKLPEPPP